MDATDLALLRELGMSPFQHGARGPDALRPSQVASRVGVSPEVAKDRIQRMERSGVIQGYDLWPNLRLLGLRLTTYHFTVPAGEKPRAVKQLRNVDGITGVFDFVGGDLCIDVFWRTPAERDRRVGLITSITGHGARPFFEYEFPATDLEPSPLDWRILLALRGDARRSYDEVAKACNISTKTVGRRMERLVAANAVDVLPLADPSRVAGIIPVNLACKMQPGRAKEAIAGIRSSLGDRMFFSWIPPNGEGAAFDFFAFAERTGEVEQLRERAAAVPGVAEVEALLPCSVVFARDWLTELLQAKVSETKDAIPETGQIDA